MAFAHASGMSSAFAIADRLILLDQGRIVAMGTAAEIRASDNAWVQRYLRGQDPEAEAIEAAPPPQPPPVRHSRKSTDGT